MNLAGAELSRWGEPRLRRWAPWLLVALTFALLLPASNIIPLLDRDEPRFAQATREMIERDDWVVPYFNGAYRFDKPILIYWMMRASYAVFGVNEFAARFPSVVCVAALVWLTFHIGTRWFSAVTGFTAGFALLTCVQLLVHGRSAVADMPMVLCVLAAHYALFELLTGQSGRWRWFFLFYGAMGVGFLAKGPVAVLLPFLTLGFYRLLFWRRPLPWRRLRLKLGLPVTLLIIAAWGVPALVRTHGEFFAVGITKHVVKRGFDSFEGHGSFAPYFYLLTAFFSLFPWIAFLGDGASALRRQWNETNAFLIAWVAGTYLLFTIYLTKLPHYVMPCFPALFLLLGQSAKPDLVSPRWARWWFEIVLGIVGAVGVVLVVVGAAVPLPGRLIFLGPVLLGAGGILIALIGLALAWRWAHWLGVILALLLLEFSTLELGVGLRPIAPARRLPALVADAPAATEWGWARYGEPSVVFYSNRRWQSLANPNAVKAFLAKPGPRVLLYQQRELRVDDWLKNRKPSGQRDLTEDLAGVEYNDYKQLDIEGVNTARGCWTQLRVLYRF